VRDPDSLYHHLRRYLTYLEVRSFSACTVRGRETNLRSFILWCDERSLTRPQQLDRPTLERYQRYLFYYRKANGEPLSLNSQRQRLFPIRLWLAWLVKQGYLLVSPATDLELPHAGRRLPRAILTAREAEAVLAQPDLRTPVGLRDRALLETLYSTGIRRMEVAGLQVHDLDFERGAVMIRQGKGKKDRLIPIGERALAWIAAYQERVRGQLVAGAKDYGWLFLTLQGEKLTPTHLTRLVADYIAKAAIGKQGSCHVWRHTMATLLLENGADIRFIQAMLGHASLSTTQIYTQVSVGQLKALHTALHPARLPEAARRELVARPAATAEDLLAALRRGPAEDED
jgi:integrase/recombinase XerD